MRLTPKFTALACAAALAACGTPQVYGVYYSSGYSPSHPQLAAASGEATAIIRANPFPEDRDNAIILAAMQGRNPGYKVYFRQDPRPDATYDYKVILTFGSEGVGVVNPCLDTAPLPPAPRTGQVDMRADFCVGSSFLSEARGSASDIQRADDSRLDRLVGDVLTDLMTDRYMDRREHRCNGQIMC